MANTYTQLYFHVVFAVKGRKNAISKIWKDDLYKSISGLVANKNQKLMIINGVQNHIHILLGTQPNCMLSELVRDIKANSSKWINEKKLVERKFEWQSGFGGFTIGQSQLPQIIDYIKKQEEHHQSKSFKDEYMEFLKAYKIDFNPEYIFTDY
tara:strand:+ start:1210 stop:1668 length:459 start_codon:yes stop_codon:yes gene_type:complete